LALKVILAKCGRLGSLSHGHFTRSFRGELSLANFIPSGLAIFDSLLTNVNTKPCARTIRWSIRLLACYWSLLIGSGCSIFQIRSCLRREWLACDCKIATRAFLTQAIIAQNKKLLCQHCIIFCDRNCPKYSMVTKFLNFCTQVHIHYAALIDATRHIGECYFHMKLVVSRTFHHSSLFPAN
jgi:hypothetical protein